LEFTSESSSSQGYNCENHSIEIELSVSINIWCRVCIWLRFFGFSMRIDACCPFVGWGKNDWARDLSDRTWDLGNSRESSTYGWKTPL